ncbi:MAG: thermosome subunit beta [Candidatus Thermoplasmatota archaeon]|nr:thermosome subunit beta [Candidatus Thermoplasmatota archaeon]
MLTGQQPIIILKEGTTREKGKGAQSSNIMAALAISNAVKSTLGPKGMDKMLVDSMGDVVVTNDGATILQEIDIEHPAAKMIVEVAKSQDEECGDGTTTAVILTGELLKHGGELLEKHIHPTIISHGFFLAAEQAIKRLHQIAIPIKKNDDNTLRYIAMTAMAGKGASGSKEVLSDIVVEAVRLIAEKKTDDDGFSIDLDNIQIQKKQGGSIEETEIIKGILLDKERASSAMPVFVKNAHIVLLNTAIEVKKTEVTARIQIQDPSQLQAFLDEEERMIKHMVDKIKETGATVVFCQKGIDDLAQHFLSSEEIFAVKQVKESDMKKLSKATNAKIISHVDELTCKDVGFAGIVEQKKIGDDNLTYITDCKNPKAVSILLRGGTEHVVDELDRAIHDSLFVVKLALEDQKMTVGAGAAATEIALALRDYAPSIGGRDQMAVEAFARAIEIIPKTLSENAGMDPIDMMIAIRTAHKNGEKHAGINVFEKKIDNMLSKHVLEPLRVSTHEIKAATEAAIMILRIDDVIAAKGSKSTGKKYPGMDDMEDF